MHSESHEQALAEAHHRRETVGQHVAEKGQLLQHIVRQVEMADVALDVQVGPIDSSAALRVAANATQVIGRRRARTRAEDEQHQRDAYVGALLGWVAGEPGANVQCRRRSELADPGRDKEVEQVGHENVRR